MARPSPYSPEFREEAAQLVIRAGRSVREIADELGVNKETLRSWARKLEDERRCAAGDDLDTRTNPRSRPTDD
ncbi:transposase [Saccharopolyspora shandongensis]|uniref:transposase n=1 Tax=Saccharopolyspora shandongensis TaxID=418495 RepID=UPI00343563D8